VKDLRIHNSEYIPADYRLPVVSQAMTIKLLATSDVTFLENTNNVGVGISATVVYTPASTFNGVKKYEVTKTGHIANEYYQVSVRKLHSTDNADTRYSGRLVSELEYAYSEIILVERFERQSDGQYQLMQATEHPSSGSTIELSFTLSRSVTRGGRLPIDDTTVERMVEYDIAFSSNFKVELANSVSLNYSIFALDGTLVDSGIVSLDNINKIGELQESAFLGRADFNVVYDTIPNNYKIVKVYKKAGINKSITQSSVDFSNWDVVNASFSVPASELKSGIAIAAIFERVIIHETPTIQLLCDTNINVDVQTSDVDKLVRIPIQTNKTDAITVYAAGKGKLFRTTDFTDYIELSFSKDFDGIYGTKRVMLVAEMGNTSKAAADSNLVRTSSVELYITFSAINDYPSVVYIQYPTSVDVPAFSNFDIQYEIDYQSFAANFIDVHLVVNNNNVSSDNSALNSIILFSKLEPSGKFVINLKKLKNSYPIWNGSESVILKLIPTNTSGQKKLVGNGVTIETKLNISPIMLDEHAISANIYTALNKIISDIAPDKESKYLTHLANFGNDEQLLISSWESDDWTLSTKSKDTLGNDYIKSGDAVESIILKLYSPLPNNISENSTLWVTKILANPLVETVVLTEQSDLKCPSLKGPNFDIDIDYVKGFSTEFESLDTLILSASASSEHLVSNYLSASLLDTTDLNIQYTDNNEYLWDNFVHFSSARERLDNFVYKVQLIESYDRLIDNAHSTGSIGDGEYIGSVSGIQEIERQRIKKSQLINAFDGFERFLYTSSSMAWPYDGNIMRKSYDPVVLAWYENISANATYYDVNNQNGIINNIPQYIVDNENNQSLLLFYTMIGQHFDSIYYYTKSIERSRSVGYTQLGGISDRILFDMLKSYSWDPKNLSADTKLWNYAFGLDDAGNIKETKSAKQRTNEIWRRIINNLPYLLKHKGTRRGIYALLACYGIPSSNLSIIEFGGPEVGDVSKGKLVMDNITSALSMASGRKLLIPWTNTTLGRRPDTVELFVKPTEVKASTLLKTVDATPWSITLQPTSGSPAFGSVIFDVYGQLELTGSVGKQAISASNIPIFNGGFFGIQVSVTDLGTDGNRFDLYIKQSDKERTIFEVSSSMVLVGGTSWPNGTVLELGGNYVGSVDEFRLWETPLHKERFFEHVSFPEMINGNHISSSTEDIFLRLDFEYPKNLFAYPYIPNVDTNIYFSGSLTRNDYEMNVSSDLYSDKSPFISFVTASGFNSINTYPYHFEPIDRTVILEIPDAGASRYSTNKVRFETQELVSNLSSKYRATKKAYDQAPVDSNRVGLFFSPTKELNFDIAKSLGGINLDDYIGDPLDRYNHTYTRLNELRKYYFQRFDGRDIYAYINLIKLYEKSMFDDIKKMLPARVKATTGLLIEPHILERNKYKHTKPDGQDNQHDTTIDYDVDGIVNAENSQYTALLDADSEYIMLGINNQLNTRIDGDADSKLTGNDNQHAATIDGSTVLSEKAWSYQYMAEIPCHIDESTIVSEIDLHDMMTVAGQSDYERLGFGIYGDNGVAIRSYYDVDGTLRKERVYVQIIRETKSRIYTYQTSSIDRGIYTEIGSQSYVDTYINMQPITVTAPITSSGNINVTPLNGYASTHYRNTCDLTLGLMNSFYKGSKNTVATTLDGTPPVETFLTNPNTLKVNKAGRDSAEPILEIE
jgi:hypothetical protein